MFCCRWSGLLAAGGRGLPQLPLANRAAATLRLQAEQTPAGLLARLRAEWTRFPGVAEKTTREVLHAWTSALLANMTGAALALPALEDLEGKEGQEGASEVATVSEALFNEWFEGVRTEHMALGIEQGVQQERARSLARLRRRTAIKFGAQAAERLANLLGTATGTEQVEQVEDWMFECDRAEDLLARVSAMRGNGSVGR